MDDTECIFTLEMLQGVAAQNQIKLFVNVINNNVMNLVGIDIHIMVYKLKNDHLKLPIFVAEFVVMMIDVSGDNVITSEVYICSVPQEVLHPVHITA